MKSSKWRVRWADNDPKLEPGYKSPTLAHAVTIAQGMDERFRKRTKGAVGTYHDVRTGIVIERLPEGV